MISFSTLVDRCVLKCSSPPFVFSSCSQKWVCRGGVDNLNHSKLTLFQCSMKHDSHITLRQLLCTLRIYPISTTWIKAKFSICNLQQFIQHVQLWAIEFFEVGIRTLNLIIKVLVYYSMYSSNDELCVPPGVYKIYTSKLYPIESPSQCIHLDTCQTT